MAKAPEAPRRPPVALEVIATTVEDGLAAQRGGADRLEVVSAMEADGLTPDIDLVRRLRDAVTLPLRVMLRTSAGFLATAHEIEALARAAEQLRAAGGDAFVFGFLTSDGHLDLAAVRDLCDAAAPAAWTLHRAFDHATGAEEAFAACARLPGLDLILTAGGPRGIDDGYAVLAGRTSWQTPTLRWMAGGGLRPAHITPLRRAGITHFHTGRAVRRGHRWDAPVDEALVREMQALLA